MTEIRTLIHRHGKFTPEEELHQVYRNLRPEYRQHIRRRDFTTLRGLAREITEYELLQKEMTPKTTVQAIHSVTTDAPDPSRDPSKQTRQTNDMCWRCGQKGHFRPECTNKARMFCWNCKRDSVLTRDCDCQRRKQAGNAK